MTIEVTCAVWALDLEGPVARLDQERFPGPARNLSWTLIALSEMGMEWQCAATVEAIAKMAKITPAEVEDAIRQGVELDILSSRPFGKRRLFTLHHQTIYGGKI